jgi:uncharacterized protein (TIGR02246 family)
MRPFFLALLLPVLAQPQNSPKGHALPDLPTQRFIDDMRHKNLEDVLALYSPDAVFVDTAGHKYSTPRALRKLYRQVFATYDSDLKLDLERVDISGDTTLPLAIIIQRGSFDENLHTRGTNITQRLCGHYTFDWMCQDDGRWLIQRMEWLSAGCPATP